MAGSEHGVLNAARSLLSDRTQEQRRLAREFLEADRALEALLRTHGASDDQVQAARDRYEKLLQSVGQARTRTTEARNALTAARKDFLGDEAGRDVARLSAELPIALFPVRIETRFDLTPGTEGVLKVRIYPDTLLVDTHDPRLTAEELEDGRAYWNRAWSEGEAGPWRDLVRQTPAPRAAWIVLRTEPVNLAERPEGQPIFPEVELRAGAWDRAPAAPVLPDRWVVVAYRGTTEAHRVVSAPVEEPLALWLDPNTQPGQGIDVSGDGLELDDEIRWTVDFERAEKVGMAVRITPLLGDESRRGFDRLVVLGVKASLEPDESQQALESLLEGHLYSRGMAFVPQGTPTNNTDASSSSFPQDDPDGSRSFLVERGPDLATPNGAGARLTSAIGIRREVFSHVEGADRDEQTRAAAMNQSLWPATWGYYLEQLFAPNAGPGAVASARGHFVESVRGRGPLSAFRLRAMPFGVLPATSLQRWQPQPDRTGIDVQLPALLRRLLPFWEARVADAPRIGRTADADADLLAVLGMDASTREVRLRTVNGLDYYNNLFSFLSINQATWNTNQILIARPLMIAIGFPNFNPRLLQLTFADTAHRFRRPLVAPRPLSETTGLEAVYHFDYVQWIREATIEELRHEVLPEGAVRPDTLLYRMLRHARLTELSRIAVDLDIVHGTAIELDRREPEMVGIVPGTEARLTPWQRFSRPIPELTEDLPLGEFLVTQQDHAELVPLKVYDAALEALEGLPTAELERLFTETLDTCSHRLDSWITSLATRRLQQMREVRASGVHLGAFGWVEDLRPEPGPVQKTTLPDGREAHVRSTNAGYVQTPSMQHAAAAAVLRSAHITRTGGQGTAYAIDLSSARVRSALSVLDAVREGQPLGAVLGFGFERALHDAHLDWFIEPLRRRFPAVANKSGDADLEGPPDEIAARSVVDGLALRATFTHQGIDFNKPDFFRAGQPPSPAERGAVEAELRKLDNSIDAVTDLLTSEAVYQIVTGNTAGANAALDAISKGTRPPDPEITHVPAESTNLTNRIALVLGGDPAAPPGWDADLTPRALTEPLVDSWVGVLSGDPHRTLCRVRLSVPGPSGDPTVVEQPISLAALNLRPIDVLFVAEGAGDGAVNTELDARVASAALQSAANGASVVEIMYARDAAWQVNEIRTFPDVIVTCRAIHRLLAVARPLAPADLVTPSSVPLLPATNPLDGETMDRAVTARALAAVLREQLASAVTTPELLVALLRASLFGIQVGLGDGALSERAAVVLGELDARISQAAAATDAPGIVKAIFGPDFPFIPRFLPAETNELRLALEGSDALFGDPRAVNTWMYQVSRTRQGIGRWRKLSLLTTAQGVDAAAFAVVQLPRRENARWAALPFAPGAEPLPGSVSVVVQHLGALDVEQPWAGLMLDEWDELIPSPRITTGVGLHFDSPAAEAPNAVLLAVPPAVQPSWTLDDLLAVVNESLELARVRAVDGELLGALGQLVPTIYMAVNAADDAVSTPFTGAVEAEQLGGVLEV